MNSTGSDIAQALSLLREALQDILPRVDAEDAKSIAARWNYLQEKIGAAFPPSAVRFGHYPGSPCFTCNKIEDVRGTTCPMGVRSFCAAHFAAAEREAKDAAQQRTPAPPDAVWEGAPQPEEADKAAAALRDAWNEVRWTPEARANLPPWSMIVNAEKRAWRALAKRIRPPFAEAEVEAIVHRIGVALRESEDIEQPSYVVKTILLDALNKPRGGDDIPICYDCDDPADESGACEKHRMKAPGPERSGYCPWCHSNPCARIGCGPTGDHKQP